MSIKIHENMNYVPKIDKANEDKRYLENHCLGCGRKSKTLYCNLCVRVRSVVVWNRQQLLKGLDDESCSSL